MNRFHAGLDFFFWEHTQGFTLAKKEGAIMAFSPWILENEWLPRVDVRAPATIYVNGRQVPPIEGTGEILCFTLGSIQIVSECKIPIPSAGKIRFSIGLGEEEVELIVDFVQRIELTRHFLNWKEKPRFRMVAAIGINQRDVLDKYQFFLHRQLFGKGFNGVSVLIRKEMVRSSNYIEN